MKTIRRATRPVMFAFLPAVTLAVAGLISLPTTSVAGQESRDLFPRPARLAPAATENAAEIVIKYRDGCTPPRASALTSIDWCRPEFPRDPEVLAAERRTAEKRSGRRLPDLALFHRLGVSAGADPSAVLADLLARDDVETAYFMPLPAPSPTDIAPATSDYTNLQGYAAAAPGGVDALYARSLPGGRGHGIAVCDIEYSWFRTHEEFHDVGVSHIGPAASVPPGLNFLAETNHGTASLGVVGADRNGYGVEGIASRARMFTAGQYTAGVYSPAAAINRAAAALPPGSILLLELQMFGGNSGTNLVPAEWHAAEYAAITSAVAGGLTVVQAAGNGGLDLSDTVEFGQLFRRSFRDSGAILVAGATSARVPIGITNHCTTDSRIDLFALGSGVVTCGYGDLFYPGGDNRQGYTAQFAGTSSASAIIAGCAASLQGIASRATGAALPPSTLRSYLVATGTAQAPSPWIIGVQPDLRAAVTAMMAGSYALPPIGLVPGTPGPNPTQPVAVRALDFNQDGIEDLVFSYEDGLTFNGFFEVAPGLGGGGFGPSLGPIGVGVGRPYLTVADFDGDGNPDIAATASTQVSVLYGDGFGGFWNQVVVPLASAALGLDAADFDGDGRIDIVTAQSGVISVLTNTGGPGFVVAQYATPGANWIDVRAADMNVDGYPDFCLVGNRCDIVLNDGFGAPQGGTFATGLTGSAIAPGDLDHDGRPDLVVLDLSAPALDIVLGDGAGQGSLSSLALPSPLFGGDVVLADMNGDRSLDAIIAGLPDAGQPGVGVLFGDGRGSFLLSVVEPTIGIGLGQVVAADLDGIAGPDVALVMTTGGPSTDAEIFQNPLYGAGSYCRAGNVGAPEGGASADVLTVNGRAGDVDRVVRVAPQTALSIVVNDPPAGPTNARYALFAVRGPVGNADATVHPGQIGTACFPTPFSSSGAALLPSTHVLVNTLGGASAVPLPRAVFTGNASRSIQIASGLGVGVRVSLQGVVQDVSRSSSLSLTNVIELEAW